MPGYYSEAWTSEGGRKQVVILVNTDDRGSLNEFALVDLLDTAYCRSG